MNVWSVLIICGCYIDCRLHFAIIPLKLFLIFSCLYITAFSLFFLIFNISDCFKDCIPVECARKRVVTEECVSWNNMMFIQNRDSHRHFLINKNVQKLCIVMTHAILFIRVLLINIPLLIQLQYNMSCTLVHYM